LAAGFLAAGFLAAGFFVSWWLTLIPPWGADSAPDAGFVTGYFFFAAGFLAAGFFAAGFLAAGFFAAGFFVATLIPPLGVPILASGSRDGL